MTTWLRILLIAGPLPLGIYLSTVEAIPAEGKIVAWIVCGLICISGVILTLKEEADKRKQSKETTYGLYLAQRGELRDSGLPTAYVNGLGENPLLEHSFNEGRKHENESRFKEAIKEYQKCLDHPKATCENRVAANILIGNCYYSLSRLKEAEKHYREGWRLSKRVKDKKEKLQGRSAAVGNIGLIYSDLGKPDEALNYLKEALEIHRKIGYEQGIANQLGNIGLIYHDVGKPDEALNYLKEALEIFKRIRAQPQIEMTVRNIRTVEEKSKRRAQESSQ